MIVSQVCCVTLPEIFDKYTDNSTKAMILVPPIATGIIGSIVNHILFF